MKNVTLLLSTLMLLLVSCNKEEDFLQNDSTTQSSWNISVVEETLHFETQAGFEAFVEISTLWSSENMKKFLEPYTSQGFQSLSETTIEEFDIPEVLWLLNEDQTIRIGGNSYSFNFESQEINILDLANNERKKHSFETDVFSALDGQGDIDFRSGFCPHTEESNFANYFDGRQMEGKLKYQSFGIYHRLYAKIKKDGLDDTYSLQLDIDPGYAANVDEIISWDAITKGGNAKSYRETLYSSTKRLNAYNLSAEFSISVRGGAREGWFTLSMSCGSIYGNWQVSDGAQTAWEIINTSSIDFDELIFGDFIGDERTDILHIAGYSTFNVSDGGESSWISFSTSPVDLQPNTVKVGNFVNGHKEELFTHWGSGWRAYSFEDETWYNLADSDYDVQDIAIGDFIGDEHDDIFLATGSDWRVSDAGQGSWQLINGSDYTLEWLAFGNFVGDQKTDVFLANGSEWKVSDAGQNNWQVLASSGYLVSQLLFGNFVGNYETDVFHATGSEWRVSDAGQTNWQVINTSGYTIDQLKVGRFIGTYTTDEVFTVE